MTEDPDALAFIFGVLQLGDQKGERAGIVRVGRVDKVKVVAAVPKVGVEG